MCRFLFFVTFCFLEVLVQQTHGRRCGVTVGTQTCAKALQPPANPVAIPGGGDALYVHSLCSGKTYETVIKCRSMLYHSVPDWKRKAYDEIKLMAAWAQLCTQQKKYSLHASCYKRKRVGLKECGRKLMDTVSHLAKMCPPKLSGICAAMTAAAKCQEIVIQPCGSEAAKIITDFHKMALPSVCTENGPRKRRVREVVKQEEMNALLSVIRGLPI